MIEFYELAPSQIAVLDKARGIARDVLARHSADVDREGRFPRESVRALGEAGLLGLTLPATAGGLGESPRTFAAVVETLGGACASTAMIYLMHTCAANVLGARADVHARVLAEMAAGRHLGTLAFSEVGSRSHFWAPVSRETARGGKLEISADKSWVTSAGEADSYIVSTLASDGDGPTASSLYRVGKGAAGLTVPGRFDGIGLRGNASAPMTLRDVAVGDGDRASAAGGGFATMMEVVLPWFQLGAAAISVGIAEAALGVAGPHLTTARLEHMGQTLAAALPNLRAAMARGRIEVDRSRTQVVFTAKALEKPGAHTMPAVLSSKAQAAEMALAVTDLTMRACGGAAFSRHLPLERHLRDARAASIMAPTTDQLHDFLGKAILGLPVF